MGAFGSWNDRTGRERPPYARLRQLCLSSNHFGEPGPEAPEAPEILEAEHFFTDVGRRVTHSFFDVCCFFKEWKVRWSIHKGYDQMRCIGDF